MGLFSRENSQGNNEQSEALKAELEALENRLDAFLIKLDERLELLLNGFIAEAPSVMAEDDRFGQAYYRFSSAMRGQAANMREKVQEVRDKQIEPVFYRYVDTFSASSDAYRTVYDWRHRCARKVEDWEERLRNGVDQAIEEVERKDYEPIFQQMMDTYWLQCKAVNCKQCGAKLNIQQVYYYSAYVTCTYCQTQNIFDPGTTARDLEQIARKLAEQRSKHLLDAHELKKKEERELYSQMHELQLSLSTQQMLTKSGPVYDQVQTLEAKRLQAEEDAPELLDQYYRSMFDELNKLLPDMNDHHEKFFRSLQANYQQYESKRSMNL